MTTTLMDRTVGELAVEQPGSIRVFEQWKIDYCCGGQTPLSEAVTSAGHTMEEFAAMLDALAVVPPLADWSAESLPVIAQKIVATYHDYTRQELATIQPLAAKVLGVHGSRHPELQDVVTLVEQLTGDLLPHMLKEEQVLFPYVDSLQRACDGSTPAPTPFFGTVKNPVHRMMMEHDRVGELLSTLRDVTTNYDVPSSACFSYRELYRRLAELEEKTHEHIHLENNLYFPRAVELEERYGNITPGKEGCGSGCGAH